MIGLNVGISWYEIGSEDFFNSFFSTICINLEKGQWGNKFPTIMKNFYSGTLEVSDLPRASKELRKIKKKLAKFSPDKIVWDVDDLNKMPPWGTDISEEITDLSNYFVTSDGEDLFKILEAAIEEAKESNEKIEIENI